MVTFFAAAGRYELRRTPEGQYPVVILRDREFALDIQEMILWSSLMWSVLTFDGLRRAFYRKEREAHVLGDSSLEGYLRRMRQRGLVVSGRGYTAEEALYDLVAKLYVFPLREGLFTKLAAFLHLTFDRKIPFAVTRKIFSPPRMVPMEQRIFTLAEQALLTTEELVRCVDGNVMDISTEQKLLTAMYPNGAPTPNEGVCFDYALSPNRLQVTEAVVNLYLQKLILFEPV
jgi:hypothetical protein